MQDVKCGCGYRMMRNGLTPYWTWQCDAQVVVEMQCGIVWCGLECVLWDSAMCNLYLKYVHGVAVRGGMWNNVLRCGGRVILCELWCDVECGVMSV